MEKLVKILEEVKVGTLLIKQAEQQVLDLFDVSGSLPFTEKDICSTFFIIGCHDAIGLVIGKKDAKEQFEKRYAEYLKEVKQ